MFVWVIPPSPPARPRTQPFWTLETTRKILKDGRLLRENEMERCFDWLSRDFNWIVWKTYTERLSFFSPLCPYFLSAAFPPPKKNSSPSVCSRGDGIVFKHHKNTLAGCKPAQNQITACMSSVPENWRRKYRKWHDDERVWERQKTGGNRADVY